MFPAPLPLHPHTGFGTIKNGNLFANGMRFEWIIPSILLILLCISSSAHAQTISVSLGPEETVFDWSSQHCEAIDIPDLPARAFKDSSGNVQLIASHYVTRRFVGNSLNTVAHQCPIIMNSSDDTDPAHFDDKEWLASTYTMDGQTIYGLVHDEFQGNAIPGACSYGDYTSCWYNAITTAVSTDAGATYTQSPSPQHLAAAIPYTYNMGVGYPFGYFNPSNIIAKDGYYYSFIHAEHYGVQPHGSCPMRTNDLSNPASWRFWNGTSFSNIPINPYASPVSDPQNHICVPVSHDQIGAMAESVTYNTYLQKYILMGATGIYDANQNKNIYGFFFSLSSDLINWGQPQLIREALIPWAPTTPTGLSELYPSLLDDTTNSRNFEVTGQHPYLYFTRKNNNPAEPSLDRDLIRIPLTFNLNSPSIDTTAPSTPSNLAASMPTPYSFQISWQASTDNVGVTGYRVSVSTSPTFDSFLPGWESRPANMALSQVISGLTPNTTYYVRILAHDAQGNYSTSNSISTKTTEATTITPPTQEFVPLNILYASPILNAHFAAGSTIPFAIGAQHSTVSTGTLNYSIYFGVAGSPPPLIYSAQFLQGSAQENYNYAFQIPRAYHAGSYQFYFSLDDGNQYIETPPMQLFIDTSADYCGDAQCNTANETCTNCPQDCGACPSKPTPPSLPPTTPRTPPQLSPKNPIPTPPENENTIPATQNNDWMLLVIGAIVGTIAVLLGIRFLSPKNGDKGNGKEMGSDAIPLS